MQVQLKPHQSKAVEEIKNGSILTGGVGTGKSITAVYYFFTAVCGGEITGEFGENFTELKHPRDLYIITTARKRKSLDWDRECVRFGLSTEREISASGVKVTVDSWQNIQKYVGVKDAFFIFDEQRLVGGGAWSKAFIKLAASNGWILLSATPGDNWLDYIPVMVAHGFYKNRTAFIRQHVVYNNFSKFPKVDRYVETGRLSRLRRSILVDMPYERSTVRHIIEEVVDHDKELMEKVVKKRWHIYEDRPIRDVGELFLVMRKLVNSDPSRLAAVAKIKKENPRLIIFYNFNYELDALREWSSQLTGTSVAEWNGQKHEETPTGDDWVYLVQYTAGAEAWNCVTTDTVIFYSLNYSYKINEQAKGRIDRLNTPYVDLYYFILRSQSVIDNAISKSISQKKSFNEKEFAGSW